MSGREKSSATNQGDLFQQFDLDTPALLRHAGRCDAPNLDLEHELLGALHQAIRQSRMSRPLIVDRMNWCLASEHPITTRMLDAWLARSKEFHRFPAAWLTAFCWATGSIQPFVVLLAPVDHDVVDARDQHALRLGQISITKSQLTREERLLRQKLGG